MTQPHKTSVLSPLSLVNSLQGFFSPRPTVVDESASQHLLSIPESPEPPSESSEDQEEEEDMQDTPVKLRALRFSSKQKKWVPTSTSTGGQKVDNPSILLPTSMRVITWNIDYQAPNQEERLQAALRHIAYEVLGCKVLEQPPPCCILLQEVYARAFHVIPEFLWFREYFTMTCEPRHWPRGSTYGTVTLVARSVPVAAAYTIEFSNSQFARNALFVDLKLRIPDRQPPENVTIRVANTHLESLPVGTSKRPEQLAIIATFLKQDDVNGGVVCGDMNAIAPIDAEIPNVVGLSDAWRSGDVEEGLTWGFQSVGEAQRFPANRLDKVLYVEDTGYEIEEPETIGVGLKIPKGQWVSDHYGLFTQLHVV